MSTKNKIILIGVGALVVAGAGLAFSSRGRDQGKVEVETSPVEARQIIQTVDATGRIQPVTQVNISADVSAKITRLEVKEGDWVEKGQLLLGGPFTDGTGGLVVLQALTAERAKEIVAADPAVKARVLKSDVRPWLVPIRADR